MEKDKHIFDVIMAECNLTQHELAEQLGISRTMLVLVAQGKKHFSIRTIMRVQKSLAKMRYHVTLGEIDTRFRGVK